MTSRTGPGDVHLPYWSPGSGHYGNTLGQGSRQLLSSASGWVLSFLDTVPVKEGAVFTMADYGANDGYSTMTLFADVVKYLKKKHGASLPVQIIYEDQEKNDFNSLFNRLSDPSSYTSQFPDVFASATNINFYKQCVPDGTCDMIFTSITTHWLESLDLTFKHGVFQFSANEEEKRVLRQAGERDWTKFLLHRAKELKPGGLLIVFKMAITNSAEQNQHDPLPAPSSGRHEGRETTAGVTVKSQEPQLPEVDVFEDLEAAWTQLRADGVITQEEYERCTCKSIIRTVEEIVSPFQQTTSPVRQAGLTLVHHDVVTFYWPRTVQWLKGVKEGRTQDRNDFAQDICDAHRVWSQTTFESSLSDMRTDQEKAAIMDRLYEAFRTRVKGKDPAFYRSDMPMSRVVIRKD